MPTEPTTDIELSVIGDAMSQLDDLQQEFEAALDSIESQHKDLIQKICAIAWLFGVDGSRPDLNRLTADHVWPKPSTSSTELDELINRCLEVKARFTEEVRTELGQFRTIADAMLPEVEKYKNAGVSLAAIKGLLDGLAA